VAIEAGLGSQGGAGEQDAMFGFEPGQGLPLADQVLARDARFRWGDTHRRARRIDQHSSGISGMQVMLQHPANAGPPGGIAVKCVSLLGGVGAQQVMAGIAAGGVLGDQVSADELRQQVPRLGQLHAGQVAAAGAESPGRGGCPAAGTAAPPPR
jgi:hypothetical protein